MPDLLCPVSLPARQFQVASLVADGQTNKEIATALGVSPYTVRNTLQNVFIKLGVRNRVGVTRLVASGLVMRSPREAPRPAAR